MSDLSFTTAAGLAEEFAAGRVSPVEACDAALKAITDRNPAVNAFVSTDPHGARQAAAESEQRWQAGAPLGPLDGIPVSIKDMLLTRGWPTLRGSGLIDPAGPWAEDAPAVARVRESGAVLLGKTTTPEFAWKGLTDSPTYGATGNPWDPGRHAGGSSGGSAAAVGLGMGPLSIGTDGAGSVRIPAAFTGTVAFKPTYGLVPIYPVSAFGSLSHAGPMARTVTDAALLLDVLARFDHRDWAALASTNGSFLDQLPAGIAGRKIAFSPDLGYVTNDPAVEETVRSALTVFESAGAQVVQANPGFDDPVDALHVLWYSGVAKALRGHEQELSALEPGLQSCIEQGRQLSALQYLDATDVRAGLGVRMGAFHTEYDLLVTPTMPITAFGTDRQDPPSWPSRMWTSWSPYTYPFNMTQQPAITVPCGFANGMPVGLQIVGPRHADQLVLQAAHAYEQRAGGPGIPPLAADALAETPPVPEPES